MGNVDGCVGDGVFNYSFARQGWQCPICKRIYAPYVNMCYYCGDQTAVSTDTKLRNGWAYKVEIKDWLSSFNTDSATECFTAVQQLKNKRGI